MSSNEPPPYPGDDPNPPAYGSVEPPPGHEPPPGYGPPGYGPPPGAPGGNGDGYQATEAFGWAWRAFRANAVQLVLATLVVAAVGFALSLLSELIAPSPDFVGDDGGFEFEGGALLFSFLVQTLTGAVSLLATAMLIRGTLDITEGRAFSIGDAFSRVPVLPVIVTGVVISLLTSIGFVLLFLPGLAFAIFSFFALYFVVDRDQSPFTALGSSFTMVGRNFGAALLSGLLAIGVLLLGAIALVVGLLVAVPVTALAASYAFRRFSGQPVVEPS